jgi:hypothetical protein
MAIPGSEDGGCRAVTDSVADRLGRGDYRIASRFLATFVAFVLVAVAADVVEE